MPPVFPNLARGEFPGDGILIVDKPSGVTSHDVVSALRRLTGTRKVGHAGTLDPLATGVLIVGVGAGTKLLTYAQGERKSYEATIRLGVTTSTEDAEGEVTSVRGASGITAQSIDAALGTMVGTIRQVPSAVSAIKVQGKRAYQRVRDGEHVELPARSVTIYSALRREQPRAGVQRADSCSVPILDVDVTVECSAGTYIRAFARDLGSALGCGGYVTSLRRTCIGSFGLDEAFRLEDLSERVSAGDLVPVAPMARSAQRLVPTIRVNSGQARSLSFGRSIRMERHTVRPLARDTSPQDSEGHDTDTSAVAAAIYGDVLVALVVLHSDRWQPRTVFARPQDFPYAGDEIQSDRSVQQGQDRRLECDAHQRDAQAPSASDRSSAALPVASPSASTTGKNMPHVERIVRS
ncbi:MAG: tRNA pseudouridine(55) synthase TruB [Actinomycetaceae bacterium]|nr:tRNA pseudouridine(55) synthase TruB [Actinomycetaceae bacterium]MDY6082997.1 tRNA pseudouridine(55) synthase TruB [Actinomycetaceae bacterium]